MVCFSNITSVHFFLHHQSMRITTDHFIAPLLNILCSFHNNPSREYHTHENTFSQFRNFKLYLLTCSVHREGKQVHMKHMYRTEYYDRAIMIYGLSHCQEAQFVRTLWPGACTIQPGLHASPTQTTRALLKNRPPSTDQAERTKCASLRPTLPDRLPSSAAGSKLT